MRHFADFEIFCGGIMAYRKFECVICGFIYDEEKGLPEEGIAPGTKWEDVPEDWECPECGVSKYDFEMVQTA
jgi:rubredoxin